MPALMELVAGTEREILRAIRADDRAGLDDPTRFTAFLSLGGGLDPTWLDLFSEACRKVTGSEDPVDFIDARRELEGQAEPGERTIERVDGGWVTAVASVADGDIDRVAGQWIDLLDEEFEAMPREDKPWIRQLASDLVAFARSAERAPDVLFAWSL
jgi:hypothetical protein